MLEKQELALSGQKSVMFVHAVNQDWTPMVDGFDTWSYTTISQGRNMDDTSECDVTGWVYKNDFAILVTRLNITYDLQDMSIIMFGNVLPCKFTDGGCESTNRDPYAYTWKVRDTCVIQLIDIFFGRMIKWRSVIILSQITIFQPIKAISMKFQKKAEIKFK